jgi:hypothetical protein
VEACFDQPLISQLRSADQLAPDSVGMPAEPVDAERFAASRENERVWLPRGHHADLHIEHDHRVRTGPFVTGSWSLCWHITVSSWNSVDAMRNTLHAKHAEVPFVIGGREGVDHPVVIQCLPLNEFGKGLVHLTGHAETNRKRCVQVEVCATPEDMVNFKHYHALANLFWLLTHGDNPRVPIANRLARSFANTKRFTESGFARVKGHFGHEHAPENTHFDPTKKFNGAGLVRMVNFTYAHGPYAL